MIQEDLSEQVWKVLNYFIDSESRKIGKYLQNFKYKDTEKFQPFSSYPDDIFQQGLKDISKPKIGDACKKLLDMRILGSLLILKEIFQKLILSFLSVLVLNYLFSVMKSHSVPELRK